MTEGTKYHPLFEHLLFSGQGRLSMSFAEIEAALGARLPPSARSREEWWSNSPNGHSQARAWMRAGYRTANVDLARGRIDFVLDGWPKEYGKGGMAMLRSERQTGFGEQAQTDYVSSSDRARPDAEREHPLFGIWEGKVTLVPGHDYTKPAFEADGTS